MSAGEIFNVVLGIGISIGSTASTLPQVFNFLKSRSTIGISLTMLMLGCLNNYTQFLNSLTYNFPKLRTCKADGFMICTPTVSVIFQAFGLSFTYFLNSLLYIIFYRPWLEENDVATSTTVQQTTVPLNNDENSTNGEQDSPISAANIPQIYSEESLGPAPSTNISLTADRSQISRAHLRDLIITYVFLVIFLTALVVLAILTTTFIAALGERHPVSLNFGTVMGIISALITVIQWSPQILRTIQTQQAGNLSIVMILILMAGGFLVLFFMIVTTRQNWSTWLPNASSSFQVTILFVLLVIFETRNRINKRRKRNQSVISVAGEEEAGGEESKLLSKTAISTSNASETTNYNTNL